MIYGENVKVAKFFAISRSYYRIGNLKVYRIKLLLQK